MDELHYIWNIHIIASPSNADVHDIFLIAIEEIHMSNLADLICQIGYLL
jgi:hypothetical protein